MLAIVWLELRFEALRLDFEAVFAWHLEAVQPLYGHVSDLCDAEFDATVAAVVAA